MLPGESWRELALPFLFVSGALWQGFAIVTFWHFCMTREQLPSRIKLKHPRESTGIHGEFLRVKRSTYLPTYLHVLPYLPSCFYFRIEFSLPLFSSTPGLCSSPAMLCATLLSSIALTIVNLSTT